MEAVHTLCLGNYLFDEIRKETGWIDANNLAHETGAIVRIGFHFGHGDDMVADFALTDQVVILGIVILIAPARLDCDDLTILLIDVILASDKEPIADECRAERFHDNQVTITWHLRF